MVKNFKYGFCTLTLMWLAITVFGQELSISGKVTNELNMPIEEAEIIIEGTGIRVYTDEVGHYQIDNLSPGTYQIKVFAIGKEIVDQKVNLIEKDLSLNFEMQPLFKELQEVTVEDERSPTFGLVALNSVEGAAIYEAKKSEVVVMEDITANLATNNSRQIYARVAGLNIWESDGAGVQLGIGGRGLSPNRNSNFNTRQNSYDIAADALGYPESYYTPPSQALRRIEIVRGAASLQYGTQFGGMLNFVFKEGPKDRPFVFNTRLTGGSFGLLNSFNSVGGTKGKVNYYGFYQYKRSDGWRPNSELDQHTAFASVKINLNERFSIKPEFTYMSYLAQQPGGLTDAQFEDDPRQSNRERNWFQVQWNLMALLMNYRLSPMTTLNSRFFGLVANRDALGNLGRIDRIDFGEERDLIKDEFRNWGNETRLIHRYNMGDQISVFLGGIRYYDGFTHRRQGFGSDGSNADFKFLNPDKLEGSDFDLPSKNISLFAENIFTISPKFSVTPGVRFEYIKTETDGYYTNRVEDLAGNVIFEEQIEEQREDQRSFIFFGVGTSYKHSTNVEFYANFSQNYRAVNFNDIRVNIEGLTVDPDIDDERGFNLELGARGTIDNRLTFDVSAFHLAYRDRIGTVLRTEPNPMFNNLVERTFRFRTNVADASIYGLEVFAELDLFKFLIDPESSTRLAIFSNIALINAEYTSSEENGIEGNEVELVPDVNFKTGLTFQKGNFRVIYQYSYISEHFSDATNAISTPTAIEGIIPSYQIMDLSLRYSFKKYSIEAGINNLTDEAYFTRRATGYPGPGIIPSDGRSFYTTLGIDL